MTIPSLLRDRFRPAFERLAPDAAAAGALLDSIRPSANPQFGDYQVNGAMVLGKRLGRPPREVAEDLVAQVDLSDVCEPPEVAGPGFINLKLKPAFLINAIERMATDERLGVPTAKSAKTVVLDYSSPNVAKPMHVGHIRSTVIGDALARTLRFAGHRVITDNHLGDWGTQFGMILYGWKHFRDEAAYADAPVKELSRLYKLVSGLVSHRETQDETYPRMLARLTDATEAVEASERDLAALEAQPPTPDAKSTIKAARKRVDQARRRLADLTEEIESTRRKITDFELDNVRKRLVAEHPTIAQDVLQETAALHAGDAENRRLWQEFLPHCREEIRRVYQRLNVTFDHEYGESHYHDMLADVVADFERRGLATTSEGAVCVFLDGFDAPMIIQKRDGAFLYATTDLATIRFRAETFQPDEILYVVDHRQSDHFDKLFAAARRWGYETLRLEHIKFGTVLGKDGKPFKTREGTAAGLDGLLDAAVAKAYDVIASNDDAKPNGPELAADERQAVASTVGHAAVKYADLSHNRTSDYVYDEDKMVAMLGNTATYLQYATARVNSIFAKAGVNRDVFRTEAVTIELNETKERELILKLLRFPVAIEETLTDYYPHILCNELYELAQTFASFYEVCSVLRAESETAKRSRLMLCDLFGRVMETGLGLLGIQTVSRM